MTKLPIELKQLIASYWPPNEIGYMLLQSRTNMSEKHAILVLLGVTAPMMVSRSIFTKQLQSESKLDVVVNFTSWQLIQRILNTINLTIELAVTVNNWLIKFGVSKRLVLTQYRQSQGYGKLGHIGMFKCQLVRPCPKLPKLVLQKCTTPTLPSELRQLVINYLPQNRILIWSVLNLPTTYTLKPIIQALGIDNNKYKQVSQNELIDTLRRGKLLPDTIVSWSSLTEIIDWNSQYSLAIIVDVNMLSNMIGSNKRLIVARLEQEFGKKPIPFTQWVQVNCD